MTQGNCQARFDIQDKADGTWHYTLYSTFSVGDSSTNYQLTIGGWSGDTGYDAMDMNYGAQFSAKDARHDTSTYDCATYYGGGFWWSSCGHAQITVSNSDYNLACVTANGWMYLNTVEIAVLC